MSSTTRTSAEPVAALFYLVPALTSVLWLVHAGWSWFRPDERDPFGLLLLIGLPVATVAIWIGAAVASDTPSCQSERTGIAAMGDVCFAMLLLAFEVGFVLMAVILLEGILVLIRSLRRDRIHARSTSGESAKSPK